MSRRRLPTLRDVMIGMSVVPQRKYKAQPRYPAKICEKKSDTLDEEGRERNPFAEEGEECFIATHERASARLYLYGGRVKRESGASVPKGSGGRSDGGTVVVVAEQRGVTWGVYDLEPRSRRAPGGEGESVPRI